MSMATTTIIGNLGSDPETRTTNGGKTVTSVSVATSHGWGDRKRTTWWKASIWGQRGEAFAENHRKGDMAALSGDAYLDEWEDRDGNKRQTLCLDANDWTFVKASDGGGRSQGGGRDDRSRDDRDDRSSGGRRDSRRSSGRRGGL